MDNMQPVEKASARRLPRQLSSFRLQIHFCYFCYHDFDDDDDNVVNDDGWWQGKVFCHFDD